MSDTDRTALAQIERDILGKLDELDELDAKRRALLRELAALSRQAARLEKARADLDALSGSKGRG